MSRILQTFSAVIFYPLAASAFVAYLLMHNKIGLPWSGWWLRIVDLPLIGIGLLYGGANVYRSLKTEVRSKSLHWFIALPLLSLFILCVVLNFWPLFQP